MAKLTKAIKSGELDQKVLKVMNQEVANAVSGYVQTLYKMNQKCILLCGADIQNGPNYAIDVLDLICDIPRVIPYQYDEKKEGICICKKNGLLEFESDINYLTEEYTRIIDDNDALLDKARLVRNKHEHKMHDVKWKHSSNGSQSLLEVGFEVSYNGKNREIDIKLGECICLLKQLNLLFDRVVADVQKYAEENGKTDYAYYNKLCQHEFKSFNTIYDSNILVAVGKAFGPY